MVRCMRLTKAIDAIAQGSNFNHEVIVLLCEIADMLEKSNNNAVNREVIENFLKLYIKDYRNTCEELVKERISTFYQPIEIPDPIVDNKCVITAEEPSKTRTMAWEKEMIPKKRGRPFKKKQEVTNAGS
jgi:hypothetical protein